ncbi:hypothetical protein L9G16_23465, partial [Shewanella sp. A25]|nr:hypothetical protein [Shewanella shenzhenensis]
LAILVTQPVMHFKDVVGPACFPDMHTNNEKLKVLVVKAMGWRKYDPAKPNKDQVKKLREVDLEIVDPTTCNSGNQETKV